MNSRQKAAVELLDMGKSKYEVAHLLGVSYNTIRNWVEPNYRNARIASAVKWAKENKERVNELARLRNKSRTRDELESANARQRARYVNNEGYRQKLKDLAKKYRRTPNGRLREKARQASLSYCGRFAKVFHSMMAAITGMTVEQFTTHVGAGEQLDHIIPLSAFDLTNPEHLVRALHPLNLRSVSRMQNQMKGPMCPEIDILKLPWCENPDALVQSSTFITRQLAGLERVLQAESETIVVEV